CGPADGRREGSKAWRPLRAEVSELGDVDILGRDATSRDVRDDLYPVVAMRLEHVALARPACYLVDKVLRHLLLQLHLSGVRADVDAHFDKADSSLHDDADQARTLKIDEAADRCDRADRATVGRETRAHDLRLPILRTVVIAAEAERVKQHLVLW